MLGTLGWSCSAFAQRPMDLIPQAQTARPGIVVPAETQASEATSPVSSDDSENARITRFDNVPEWNGNSLSQLRSSYDTLNISLEDKKDGTSEATGTVPGGYWWRLPIKERQRATNQKLDVSLNGLLVSALSNSARVQVLADEPLITETEITTADANFDWYSFLEARWDDVDEPVGSTLTTGGPDRFRDHNVSVSGGIRRRNQIGGEFEVSQRLGHQNNNSVFFVPNDQGTSRLTFSYTQPLLRGAGRVYNTSFTVLAKLNTRIADNEFNRQLQEHLLDVTQAYWNLYFERGKLLQQQKLLESGLAILEELESREAVDALQSQIVRARAAVENRRAQLIRARLAIKIAEARIRALVNDPGLGDTLNMELVPIEDISEMPMMVDVPQAISDAMKNRPEVSAAMEQVKAACVRMNLSKNETLPMLNVVLDSYLAGLEGRSQVLGAFNDQFTEGVPSYGIGIQYEYPFWNRAAQSKLQKRRLELRRLQHQFRQTVETLKLEVEVAVHELNAAFESLHAKRRAMDAANAEVDYLLDRWQLLPIDNGSASLLLEDLLDAQDRLTDSEQSLLQSTLEYGLAQVTYKKAIGALLSHNSIEITRSCECKLPAQHAVQKAIQIQTEPMQWQMEGSEVTPATTGPITDPSGTVTAAELLNQNYPNTGYFAPAIRPAGPRMAPPTPDPIPVPEVSSQTSTATPRAMPSIERLPIEKPLSQKDVLDRQRAAQSEVGNRTRPQNGPDLEATGSTAIPAEAKNRVAKSTNVKQLSPSSTTVSRYEVTSKQQSFVPSIPFALGDAGLDDSPVQVSPKERKAVATKADDGVETASSGNEVVPARAELKKAKAKSDRLSKKTEQPERKEERSAWAQMRKFFW